MFLNEDKEFKPHPGLVALAENWRYRKGTGGKAPIAEGYGIKRIRKVKKNEKL